MSLIKYKAKRNFKSTAEPSGGKPTAGQLKFVIQKHDASRLHYDFRLEMEGVLKSWAVPKGPSTDPATKRLAMMVEDHPYDYKDFEGIISEGNYGAGTVIVWDQGTYEPIEPIKGKKAQEKELLKQLNAGSIKIVMHGEKMKGEWALVHTKQSENSWLLIKHKDEFASTADITNKSKSVVSGLTLVQMEKEMNGKSGNLKSPAKKAASGSTPDAKKETVAAIKKTIAGKTTSAKAATEKSGATKTATKKTTVPKAATKKIGTTAGKKKASR